MGFINKWLFRSWEQSQMKQEKNNAKQWEQSERGELLLFYGHKFTKEAEKMTNFSFRFVLMFISVTNDFGLSWFFGFICARSQHNLAYYISCDRMMLRMSDSISIVLNWFYMVLSYWLRGIAEDLGRLILMNQPMSKKDLQIILPINEIFKEATFCMYGLLQQAEKKLGCSSLPNFSEHYANIR